MKKQSPCMGCEDRCIGCHTTCGDYAIYKAELEKAREIQAARNAEIEFTQAVKATVMRRAAKKK